MTSRRTRFNTYLLPACAILSVCGCFTESYKKKRAATTIEVHLEASSVGSTGNMQVTIPRDHPTRIAVMRDPFLTEANVLEAQIVNNLGGFSMTVQFDRRGTWLLEQYSGANRGKRLAILVHFGDGLRETRWLAAPMINRHINNGALTFTPDASRQEADKIVLGLNNVSKKIQQKDSTAKW